MNINDLLNQPTKHPIQDNDIIRVWEKCLRQSGMRLRQNTERSNLTDGHLWLSDPVAYGPEEYHRRQQKTPIHIKVIGRHINGSFRCHIGTGKASRPIRSVELCAQMRLIAVFFRIEGSKHLVSPEFIFFPTWLLHLFRYTQHGHTPGRTDIRFLENERMAKEDHIYRLNHVINTLFRFHLHQFDHLKVRRAVALANFLFDRVGLDHDILPRITSSDSYCHLIHLLQAPRPPKTKPTCKNCNTKPASRRSLCVACYRYELKHHEPRPLRLIIANRPGPRSIRHIPGSTSSSSVLFFDAAPPKKTKTCDNCSIQETHQWYRNLVGKGHWCETCKSYYLRHGKIRPPVLFVKAAKRKINVKTLVHYWNALPSPSNESLSSEELSPSPTSPPIALFPNDTLLTLPSWCLQ